VSRCATPILGRIVFIDPTTSGLDPGAGWIRPSVTTTRLAVLKDGAVTPLP